MRELCITTDTQTSDSDCDQQLLHLMYDLITGVVRFLSEQPTIHKDSVLHMMDLMASEKFAK